MNALGKPHKVVFQPCINVYLTSKNFETVQKYQARLQDTRGVKVSASSIVNECIHNYLTDKV